MPDHDKRLGLSVTHRRYIGHNYAHYAGNLVDGAFTLGLFGDVATELCIRSDGDEGLFVGYSSVEFVAPVQAGDVIETRGTISRIGNTSREIVFEACIVCRGTAAGPASAAEVLPEPLVAVTAIGTVVVPHRRTQKE